MEEAVSVAQSALTHSLAAITIEMLVLAGIIAFAVMITRFLGKTALFSLTLSIYPALLLTPLILGVLSFSVGSVVVFVLLLIGFYFLLEPLLSYSGSMRGVWGLVRTAIYGVSFGVALVATTYAGVDISSLYTFSTALDVVFSKDAILIFSLVQPLVVMRFV